MSQISQVHDVVAALLKLMVPGDHFELIVASTTPFTDENRPRAIYCGVSGTATVIDMHGHTEAGVPFIAGSEIPNRFSAITSITSATLYGIR
jgi:2'-5' RNA ligase